MRRKGHAVESTCRVLGEQGCPVAADLPGLEAGPDTVVLGGERRGAGLDAEHGDQGGATTPMGASVGEGDLQR